jgi:uncharacterized protein (DUF58 family)
MITYASPKLPAYTALAAAGCLVGLALQRPEPVLLGAPFLFALVIGAVLTRPLAVHVAARLLNDRAVEGDEVTVVVDVNAAAPVPWVEVALRLPDGLALAAGPAVDTVAITPGVPYRLERAVRCRRWGGYLLGEVVVRSRDPLGFFVLESETHARFPLRVYPKPETLRSIVPAAETQVFAGNELSRTIGEGIEFADTRPFMPGDRLRRINWRLTTRLGEPYVNELHRERSTDVVLFLDTFAEARRGNDGTRFQAVRAAAALADRYLQRRDRIGLISFGGVLRWLQPAMGRVQQYRIIDALIETDIVFSYAWKAITVIPPAVLPPKALVIAITPLLDERAIDALLNLRARRFDLAIIEVSPVPFVTPPPGAAGDLAFRIWQLDREVMRDRFRRLGVSVTVWVEGQPLEQSVQEVQAFRRYARLAHA